MVFLLAGAWPVFGFFGLDVLLVYWAFRLNYRSAKAYEQVTVTPSELTVRKVSHHGRVSEWTLNPLWVRLERDRARGIRHRAAVPGLARAAARRSRAFSDRRRRKASRSRSRPRSARPSADRPDVFARCGAITSACHWPRATRSKPAGSADRNAAGQKSGGRRPAAP